VTRVTLLYPHPWAGNDGTVIGREGDIYQVRLDRGGVCWADRWRVRVKR
jgi:hypothetical protein